ncbi:MAG TPA: GxxExxY protein [Armatimonadota bacterium]|nr:GxxExxY protein [Armatimonadota bacterium]
MDENELSYVVIGAVIEVHRELGPGLPEGVYEEALAVELEARAIPFERQRRVPVLYKDQLLESTFRLDFLIAGKLIIELKAVAEVSPLHEAQLLSYLKLTGCRLGLLINFNVERAKDGIYRKALNL